MKKLQMSHTVTFLVVAALLSGCTTFERYTNTRPYFEVGQGYQLNSASDALRSTDQPYECSKNFPTELEIGTEFRPFSLMGQPAKASVAYNHQSWLLCGEPFNDRPETHADKFEVSLRIGGF